MIKIENLSVQIGQKIIIDSLNVSFNAGQISAVYGFNGIGKTTLFNCLYGLRKFSGSVKFNDLPIKKDDCSYMMTDNYFYPNLLALEYLSIFRPDKSVSIFKIESLAELLNIPLDQNIDTFSTGMKKKLSFLSVIKLNRNVFLLDEPFNGVDYESILVMKKILLSLIDSKKTVIITSHIHNHIMDLCNQVLVIQNSHSHSLMIKKEFESYLNELENLTGNKVNESKI
jgi:ABC-2 type transport system ATP-binding protein